MLEIVLLSDLRVKVGSFSRLYWWYEDEVIMIVPARSPSEPELWSEYSNKEGNCSQSGAAPWYVWPPQPTGPAACIIRPEFSFLS